MIPIFTKLLAMSIEASKIFGCSSRLTIRLKDGCCLVFKTLMSFDVSEKKATSLPARKKDNTNRMMMEKIRIVVAAVVIARKASK